MSLIAPGVKFWSWRGALHVAQSFTMFCLPGYALYKLNTSDMVRGDLEQKLPKRPDLPMGGNASNRVYSPGEQRLQDMLKKVERGERVELATPHDVPEEVREKTGMAQHPISHLGYRH